MDKEKINSKNVRIENLLIPLNKASNAKIDIHSEAGNLSIDQANDGAQVLVNGVLEYFEKQGAPIQTIHTDDNETVLTLKGGGSGKPWFRFPWAACNGAHEWTIHLNPRVNYGIVANSGGGNVKLNLEGLILHNVSTETGGGNIEICLPEATGNIDLIAKTGAGNVTIELAKDTEAKIYVSSGLGALMVDPKFTQIDKNSYQTPGFENAVKKAEIKATTGAGVVSITFRM